MIKRLKSLIPQRSPIRLCWHYAKALLAAFYYGFPSRKLTVIAITGTDGKTTTVGMIAHILLRSGKKVGAASTAFMQVNEECEENATHLTSISPFTLQKFLRRLVREGCTHAVVEMSSHGLVQGRVLCTYPKVAGITNTALEHLDYHGSMDQYRKDKGIMFQMLRGKGTKVLNGNDESYELYRDISTERTFAYGPEDSDLFLRNIQADPNSSSALILGKKYEPIPLTLNIPGTFNLENALCAIGCSGAVGIPVEEAAEALISFHSLQGRMEAIQEGQDFSVFVDFAVSPQAYEKTLEALRAMVGDTGRVLVLCSSCGDRMCEKRPKIGSVCSKLADVVVVTEDETYGEDPHKVLEEVWEGIEQSQTDAHNIFDRKEAIQFIFNEAQKGDAVVLCGMGPFSTMTTLEGRIPWDEREVARELLRLKN
jgi:UDP-N-acetylmuramoyl-L-alanyl-D-glutamate--2,6-diaminopimelate ligase